jgi:GAF domain-containing protein
MVPTYLTIGRSVAAATRSLHQRRTLQDTLEAIVYAAQASIPGFDHVGISTLAPGGRLETRAATGDVVTLLDTAQGELGEGPCLAALTGEEVVAAPHLRHDQRWPRYVPVAVGQGLRSQLGFRLHASDAGDGALGSLNLYSTTSDDISAEAEATAELFAAHAAIALDHARERETLNQALRSRKVIGQALGILMERYEMDEDRAFAFLVRASSHGQIKLRDIAQRLVDERNAG